MKLLVTGANGQVGTALCARIERDGQHELVATDVDTMNLGSRDSVLGVICASQPDVVLHIGAMTAVDRCEQESDLAYRINSLGTRHVVDAASRVGARVLYVSTDYVFDGTLTRAYHEWDTPNPQSVYGRSKLGGERELREIDTIVRTSWVFGRHGHNIVRTILKLMTEHETLSFVNDQRGKPTYAEDLVDVIYELAVGYRPGLFHVTNDSATTWFDFAQSVLRCAGEDPARVLPVSTEEMAKRFVAARPANSELDNAALRLSDLPILRDHREALAECVDALKGDS